MRPFFLALPLFLILGSDFYRLNPLVGRLYLIDGAVLGKGQTVNAHFAVEAGAVIQIVLVDAVIDDIPLVGSGYIDY